MDWRETDNLALGNVPDLVEDLIRHGVLVLSIGDDGRVEYCLFMGDSAASTVVA